MDWFKNLIDFIKYYTIRDYIACILVILTLIGITLLMMWLEQ